MLYPRIRRYTRVLAENNGAFSVFLESPRKSSALLQLSCFSSPSSPFSCPLFFSFSLSSLPRNSPRFSLALFIAQPLQLSKPCRVTLRRCIVRQKRVSVDLSNVSRNRINSSSSFIYYCEFCTFICIIFSLVNLQLYLLCN